MESHRVTKAAVEREGDEVQKNGLTRGIHSVEGLRKCESKFECGFKRTELVVKDAFDYSMSRYSVLWCVSPTLLLLTTSCYMESILLKRGRQIQQVTHVSCEIGRISSLSVPKC